MKTTRTIGATAAALLLAGLAACGGDSDTSDPVSKNGSGDQGSAASAEEAVKELLLASLEEDVRGVCVLTLDEQGAPRSDEDVDTCVEQGEKSLEEVEQQRADASAAAQTDEQKKQLEAQEKEMEQQKDHARTVLSQDPTKVGEEKDGQVEVTYTFEGTDVPFTAKEVEGSWYVVG